MEETVLSHCSVVNTEAQRDWVPAKVHGYCGWGLGWALCALSPCSHLSHQAWEHFFSKLRSSTEEGPRTARTKNTLGSRPLARRFPVFSVCCLLPVFPEAPRPSGNHLLVCDNALCSFLPGSVAGRNGKQRRVHPAWAPVLPGCPLPTRWVVQRDLDLGHVGCFHPNFFLGFRMTKLVPQTQARLRFFRHQCYRSRVIWLLLPTLQPCPRRSPFLSYSSSWVTELLLWGRDYTQPLKFHASHCQQPGLPTHAIFRVLSSAAAPGTPMRHCCGRGHCGYSSSSSCPQHSWADHCSQHLNTIYLFNPHIHPMEQGLFIATFQMTRLRPKEMVCKISHWSAAGTVQTQISLSSKCLHLFPCQPTPSPLLEILITSNSRNTCVYFASL